MGFGNRWVRAAAVLACVLSAGEARAEPGVDYLDCLGTMTTLDRGLDSPFGYCLCQLLVAGMPEDVAVRICTDTYPEWPAAPTATPAPPEPAVSGGSTGGFPTRWPTPTATPAPTGGAVSGRSGGYWPRY